METTIDFFIAGVQKGGTTALDWYLRGHPSIQMATVKEVHHFDNESIDWSQPRHDALHSKFDWSKSAVIRGEATPIYSYWPSSMARIRDYNPSARLIIGLRHPTWRAWSHWRMQAKRGLESLCFREAITTGRNRVRDAADRAPQLFSYVERGFYSEQIESLLSLFPRENTHFFRTDQLWGMPANTLSDIEAFLGIDHRLGFTATPRYTVPLDARQFGELPKRDKGYLDELYEEEIVRTAELVGMDLSDWLAPDYVEEISSLEENR